MTPINTANSLLKEFDDIFQIEVSDYSIVATRSKELLTQQKAEEVAGSVEVLSQSIDRLIPLYAKCYTSLIDILSQIHDRIDLYFDENKEVSMEHLKKDSSFLSENKARAEEIFSTTETDYNIMLKRVIEFANASRRNFHPDPRPREGVAFLNLVEGGEWILDSKNNQYDATVKKIFAFYDDYSKIIFNHLFFFQSFLRSIFQTHQWLAKMTDLSK